VAPDLAERDPAFGRTVCTNLRNRSGWVGLQVTGFVEIGTHRFGMNIFYGGENVTVSAKSQNETRFLLALIQHFPRVAAIAADRAQSDEACKGIEVFLAKVQRISATGSFFWRAATAEITASEQLYHIFDLDPALPLTLQLIAAGLHPDDLPLFHERIEQARRAVSDVDFEPRLRVPDGSVKYLHVVAHGIGGQAGQLEYIGAVHDVTSRRLSEEAPGHARAALTHMARLTTLGMLAPSIAHEVTQPLAGIVTNANTCLRALATDPPNLDGARAAARRALRDVERAHDLITRLRMLVAKKEVTCESLDLNDAIRETVALLSSELQKHRVAEELANRLRTSCWSCTRSPLTRGRSPANSVATAKASNTFV
jgi:signal transduction histidine kinase